MLNTNIFKPIKTERMSLRKPKSSDWKAISYLRSDKNVNQFVKRPSAETKEKALAFIEKVSVRIDQGNLLYWVIIQKHSDKMLGSICLWNFSNNLKMAEVGYDLHPNYQGKGLMNEALKSLLEFGFNNLNLNVIGAYTQKNNEPSKNLLVRNNFKSVKDKKDESNFDNIVYEIKREYLNG